MKKIFLLFISVVFTQSFEVDGDLKVEGSVIFSDNTEQNSAASLLPAGIFLPYAGIEAPDGFLLCYGQEISREQYSSLFNAIGIQYGDGNGTTTFNLPDMRGRTPVGTDNMGGISADRVENEVADVLGGNAGQEHHMLTTNEMPSHSHIYQIGQAGAGGADMVSPYWAGVVNRATSETGNSQPHNNMPPYLTINYIIKY